MLWLCLALSACTFTSQLPGAPRSAGSPVIARGDTTPAYFDKNGMSIAPGPKPNKKPATCGAAQDHCLHPDTWFARTHQNWGLTAYLNGGAFYHWTWGNGTDVPLDASVAQDIHRTRPAAPSDLRPGMMVVAWGSRDNPLPTSTDDAQMQRGWVFVEVAAVEGDQVRITTVDGLHPIDRFRVIVETRPIQ
jgi:hypothetical protein